MTERAHSDHRLLSHSDLFSRRKMEYANLIVHLERSEEQGRMNDVSVR